MKIKNFSSQKGQMLLEALLASSLAMVIMLYAVNSLVNLMAVQLREDHRLEATNLAIEGMELTYNYIMNMEPVVDYPNFQSSINLAPGHILTRYPKTDVSAPFLSTNLSDALIKNTYTRNVMISYGKRDGTLPVGNLTESGGSEDPDTLKIVSNVTWVDNRINKNVTLTMYIIKL